MTTGSPEETKRILKDHIKSQPNIYCGICLLSDTTIFMMKANLYEIDVKEVVNELVAEGEVVEIVYGLDCFHGTPQSAYIVGGKHIKTISNRKEEDA